MRRKNIKQLVVLGVGGRGTEAPSYFEGLDEKPCSFKYSVRS